MAVSGQFAGVPQHIFLFLLSSVGLIVLPHAWNIVPVVFAFFCCLWLWRLVGIWRPQYLPNRILLFLLTCVGIALLYSQHQGVIGRDAGISIFIAALALKLLEIKSARELYLTIYLAFIVAATLFLYQQSLFMAAYIAGICVSLLAIMCAINSRITQISLSLKMAASLLLQTLPLALVLFVLFPRLEAPRWAFLPDKSLAKSGLGETLEPGSISNLGLSDELVFRVKFTGALPPHSQLYWRGPVFSYTDGKQWVPSRTQAFRKHLDDLSVQGTAYQYTLMLEPQAKNWVFALDMPGVITGPLTMTADYQLLTTGNPELRSEYGIRSYTQYHTGALHPLEQRENIMLPKSVSPAIHALVEQLHGFDQAPEVFVQNVLQYFRDGNFRYSLTPPLLEDSPIDRFLFETRTGFCSHYATAFVYLMRVAHIPARVVAGYQGGTLNSVGDFVEVRQADAHSWTEVWLAGKGWTRIDPTNTVAPERIEQGVNIDLQIASGLVNFLPFDAAQQNGYLSAFAQQLQQGMRNVDYSWQRWVINYSMSNQARLLSGLGLRTMVDVLGWLLLIFALLTGIAFVLLMWQQRQKVDVASRYYQKFCRRLGRLNMYKAAGETATDFAQRVVAVYPQLQHAILPITQSYLELRYGTKADEQALLVRLIAQIKAFERIKLTAMQPSKHLLF